MKAEKSSFGIRIRIGNGMIRSAQNTRQLNLSLWVPNISGKLIEYDLHPLSFLEPDSIQNRFNRIPWFGWILDADELVEWSVDS